MTTSAHQLSLTLPAAWRVFNVHRLAEIEDVVASLASTTAQEFVGTLAQIRDISPDLVATLSLPLTRDDGGLAAILLAGMVAVTLPAGRVPDDRQLSLGTVVGGVPVNGAVDATFFAATHEVVADDGAAVTFLSFSSPNVNLAPILAESFASIAATARLVAVTTD